MVIHKTDTSFFPSKDMIVLKNNIKIIWDSIHKSFSKNIIEYKKYRRGLCIKYKRIRLDKELLRKISQKIYIKLEIKTQK